MSRLDAFRGLMIAAATVSAAGCATTKPELSTDLLAGLETATVAESVYAARADASPVVVGELIRLLASAQSAMAVYQNASSPNEAVVVSAAIAALVEYEASAKITP